MGCQMAARGREPLSAQPLAGFLRSVLRDVVHSQDSAVLRAVTMYLPARQARRLDLDQLGPSVTNFWRIFFRGWWAAILVGIVSGPSPVDRHGALRLPMTNLAIRHCERRRRAAIQRHCNDALVQRICIIPAQAGIQQRAVWHAKNAPAPPTRRTGSPIGPGMTEKRVRTARAGLQRSRCSPAMRADHWASARKQKGRPGAAFSTLCPWRWPTGRRPVSGHKPPAA